MAPGSDKLDEPVFQAICTAFHYHFRPMESASGDHSKNGWNNGLFF